MIDVDKKQILNFKTTYEQNVKIQNLFFFKDIVQPNIRIVTFNKETYIKHLVWKLDGSVATCLVVVGSHLLVLLEQYIY